MLSKRNYIVKEILLAFVFTIMSFAILSQRVSADELQTIVIDETMDVIFTFQYDNEIPSVVLTSPDGTVYDSDDDFEKCEKKEELSLYYIANAAKGEWKINCDKKNNSSVVLNVIRWYREITIESFTLVEQNDDEVKVSADVTGELDENYDWYIYAVSKNQSGMVSGQKELKKTGGRTNQKAETTVSLKDLPDGEYYLMMEAVVTYSDGVEMSQSSETSDPIVIKGHTEELSEQVVVILDLTKGEITVDWSEWEENCDSCILALFHDGDVEPFFYEKVDETTYSEVTLDSDTESDMQIVLTPISNGRDQKQYVKSVPFDPGVSFAIETEENTFEQMASVKYDTGAIEDVFTQVFINGKETDYNLHGSGVFGIRMEDMNVNQIDIQYLVNGIFYRISKRISVDSLPPILSLYGVDQTIITSDKTVTISGLLENGISLQIDGEETSLNEDGTFSVSVPVDSDHKIITITGVGKNGVQTMRTVEIQRMKHGPVRNNDELTNRFPGGRELYLIALIILLISGLILLLEGVLLNRKYSGFNFVYRMTTLFLIELGIIGLALCGYCIYKYTELHKAVSGDSLTGILQGTGDNELSTILEESDKWLELSKISGLFAGIILLLIAALIVFRRAAIKARQGIQTISLNRTKKKKKKEKKDQYVYCPICGEKNKAEATFCGNCGNKLPEE